MDPQSIQTLEAIIRKSPGTLTKEEREFLRARRSYLKKSDEREFKSVLDAKEEPEKVEEVSEEDEVLLEYRKEAKKLKITFDENTTKEELVKLIAEQKTE